MRVQAQAISLLNVGESTEVRIDKEYKNLKQEVTTGFLLEKEYLNIYSGIKLLKQKEKALAINSESFDLGETNDFFVRDVRASQVWITRNATLAYTKENINVWVETATYDSLNNGVLFTQFLSEMEGFLFEKTPKYSINPETGILPILQQYAGEFPNVDGDGFLDIIFLDIEDNFEESGSFVAGFFDPVNLIDHEYSNKRDLIYLDIYPTLIYQEEVFVERALSTLAHEAQHLIHAGYEGNQTEIVFANEGFSEAVEVLAGFTPRDPNGYLQSPLRSLTSWDHQNPIPDYSRASLWTHYLTEQFGAEILKNLIQNTKVGISAYSEAIESFSSLSFEEVFQNWGMAMSINDVSYGKEYGYDHPERKDFKFLPIYGSHKFPDVISGNLPDLTHALISYPLSTEAILEEGKGMSNSLEISSFSIYPESNAVTKISKGLRTGDRILADSYKHGNISLLFSIIQGVGVDTSLTDINFMVDGRKSGVYQTWRYGDGVNDTFYSNASYLTLDSPEEKLGIIFPPSQDKLWLESITLKNVFLSELIGTGVEGYEKRDFELEIFSYKNGTIGEALIPKQNIEVQREIGKLVKEEFPLGNFYNQLSSVKDSILIVIGNDSDDQNYIALGMDKSDINGSLYYGNGYWESLSNKEIGGNSLEGWNPMIEANVVINQKNEIELESIFSIEYDFEEVEVFVNPGFEHDSASVSLVVKLPDGNFERGKLIEYTPEGYQFMVPVQVDGEYQFIASFSSGDGEQLYTSEKEWSIEIPGGFLISNNYPNPFNPSTNVSFTLIERGEVSWQVFDVLGRRVLKISPELFESGEHTQTFNFQGLASGMYIVRANLKRERNNRTINKTKKVMLIK